MIAYLVEWVHEVADNHYTQQKMRFFLSQGRTDLISSWHGGVYEVKDKLTKTIEKNLRKN